MTGFDSSMRKLRIAYIVHVVAMIILALVHTAHAQTVNPYTDPEEWLRQQRERPQQTWSTHTSPIRPDCVGVYGNTIWMCPSTLPATVPDLDLGTSTLHVTPLHETNMPAPSSRMLMFGNVVTGRDAETQNYVPFLNLSNGWQPQAFLVTIVVGDENWEYSFDMNAWSHKSVNLRELPALKNKVTGFGMFVQAWGVATATVSLHRASDPWGSAYQTIQPDTMPTPSVTTPEL